MLVAQACFSAANAALAPRVGLGPPESSGSVSGLAPTQAYSAGAYDPEDAGRFVRGRCHVDRGTRIRGVARNLWIGGKTESEVAKAVGTSLRNIVRWRDRDSWADLRMLIESRAAVLAAGQGPAAEERQAKILDVIDNIVIRMLSKEGAKFEPKDVKLLTATMRESQVIRNDTALHRRIRELQRESAERDAELQTQNGAWR